MNIVFDLGKVVFKWEFENLIDNNLNDINKRKKIVDKIFHHKDWIELDRGTLDLEDAIERGTVRTGLPKEDIVKVLSNIPQSLIPDLDTLDIIKRIKNLNNHKLFVLSNMHTACADHIEKEFDFWDLFDGIIYSCRINMVKPENGIYKYLLSEYNLNSMETVFIDDREENLLPAEKLGIKTIKFFNPQQCEEELIAIGIL